MAKWLDKGRNKGIHPLVVEISSEAQAVLKAGKKIYQFYFANLNQLRTPKFKIETWDAGWWQIRQALNDVDLCGSELKELKAVHDALKEKILIKLKEYGIVG
jgi:hypothetical protein